MAANAIPVKLVAETVRIENIGFRECRDIFAGMGDTALNYLQIIASHLDINKIMAKATYLH